ncbi:hypothetical protein ACFX2J_037955 [Malus domestica]
MGKSTADLPNQNAGHHVPQAQNPISAVTPESTSATLREREVNLGGQVRSLEIPDRNTCVLNEGVIEDCDEDGGEGSDPPTRSFLRKRLDEQSRTIEQTLSRGINKLHDVIRNSSEAQTRLLEILVSKVTMVEFSILPSICRRGIICYQVHRPSQFLLGSGRFNWKEEEGRIVGQTNPTRERK